MPIGPDTDRQGVARADRSGDWVWNEKAKSRTRMHTEAEMEEQRAKAKDDPNHIPSIGTTDYGVPFMGGATQQELDEDKPAGHYASKGTEGMPWGAVAGAALGVIGKLTSDGGK